jgi:membrane associated rhomboid family serine protease
MTMEICCRVALSICLNLSLKKMVKVHIRKIRITYFTAILAGLCCALYLAISFVSGFGEIDEDTYIIFGAPYAVDIYLGQRWGVVTNSFIHVIWYQLAVNIILLLIFGPIIEKRSGPFRLFLFGLVASTVTSCVQLALSNDAGLGLSGVNYALYGFCLVKSYTDTRYNDLPMGILSALMFTILALCIYLNLFQSWNFGLASMYSGFVWGCLTATLSIKPMKYISGSILFSVAVLCAVSLFYAPWSAEWQLGRGVLAHEQGRKETAYRYYQKCLSMKPGHKLAKENLKLMHIDELSEQAYSAHVSGDYSKARDLYLEILRMDRNNRWAKENLNQLP